LGTPAIWSNTPLDEACLLIAVVVLFAAVAATFALPRHRAAKMS